MFTVQDGKITSEKTLDIGKSKVADFVFKFADTAFDDNDKFTLTLGENNFTLYAFTDTGCIRFSYVDLSEKIKKENTDLSVKVTCNDEQILSDQITLVAEVQGGSVDFTETTATADKVLNGYKFFNADGQIISGNIDNATITTDETNGLTVNITKGYVAADETRAFDPSVVTETDTKITISRGWLKEDKAFQVGGGGSSDVQGIVYDNVPAKVTTVQIIPETFTADLTDFSSMFRYCSSLTTIPAFDTSNGTDFSGMFSDCSSLTTIPAFDTSNGTDFSGMFFKCSKLTTIPAFDTSNGTNFDSMFSNCTSLTTIPALDTSKGTDFSSMFSNCRYLTTIPAFDTSNGTDFSGMFRYCYALTTIEGIDFSGATSSISSNIFGSCSALTSVKVNGTIAKNIDFSGAPNLDAASCISIAQALVVNTGTLTITFSSTTYDNILLDTIMPNTALDIKGYIVSTKGWAIKTA